MQSFLVKKTFAVRVSRDFLVSENRDRLREALLDLGANKVKRVGCSKSEMLYISFLEDYRDDYLLQDLIDLELKKYNVQEKDYIHQ